MRRAKPPNISIRSSTTIIFSAQNRLRPISAGTSYRRIRLAFHPQPHVMRTHNTAPLQTSTSFYRGFILHRARSSGFWSYSYDLGTISTLFLESAKTWFPYDFRLAIQKNSLARFSKRKTELRKALSPISTMFQIFSSAVKHSFQLFLAVLVRYRTCVIFRFGGQCPPHSRLISKRRYSGKHF